jgi:hypothetical protein
MRINQYCVGTNAFLMLINIVYTQPCATQLIYDIFISIKTLDDLIYVQTIHIYKAIMIK